MTDVNTVAEPSAATFNPSDQLTWSSEQREHWNQTGKTPEPPKAAESAPADPPKEAKSEGKPKSAAETEAAPKQEKRGKATAEERISELVAEREAERAERKSLEERLRKLESSPQTDSREQAKQAQNAKEPPKRPNPYTFNGTPEDLEKAMDEYEQWRDQQTELRLQQRQTQQQVATQAEQMLADAAKKYPDARDKIVSAGDRIAKLPDSLQYLKVFISHSEAIGDLLYTLSDEKTLNQVLEVAKTNPSKVMRVLRDMERDIEKATAKPTEDDKPKADAEKRDTPAKPEPRAPKPPSEVGGRGTAPTDELAEAARSGDYRKFEAEQNRRMRANAKA